METRKEKQEPGAGIPGSPDFSTLVMSLAVTALGHMGIQEEGQNIPVSLPMASQTIDIISMLKEKTRGNLEEHEQKLIDSLLYELRIKYVEAVEKQQKEQKDGTD